MKFMSSIRFSVFACVVLALAVSASAQTSRYVSLDGVCEGNTPCYSTVQAAIDAASNGDEVVVLPGTYSANPVANINNKAITLRSSGGPDVTFLTGPSVFSSTVTLSSVGSNTILEGFTIRDSKANFQNVGTVHISGSPTIRDCVFKENNIAGNSGPIIRGTATSGMTITNCTFINNNSAAIALTATNLTIDGCTFIGNNASPGMHLFKSVVRILGSASIQNCDFVSNNSLQGTVYFDSLFSFTGDIVITNCLFTGNSAGIGGGVYAKIAPTSPATLTVIDSTFDGNISTTSGGGAYLEGPNSTVIGCTFTNNTAVNGGGLALRDGGTAINCTLSGNHATDDGGGAFMLGTDGTLINCTVLNNTADGVRGGVRIGTDITATINDSFLCDNMPDQLSNDGVLFTNGLIACSEHGPTVGACCLSDGSCVVLSEAHCSVVNGTYHGDDTSCADVECIQPCLGDLNGDNIVDVLDLLQLLSAWGNCP